MRRVLVDSPTGCPTGPHLAQKPERRVEYSAAEAPSHSPVKG